MNINEKFKLVFKQLGKHIQNLREERNLSIEEMAEKTGIRKEYLLKIENGTAYGVSMEKHLLKIVKVLNISFYMLFDF